MYSPPSSPVSPTRPQRVIPHGFLAPPKPKHRSVQEMSIRELHDRYDNNAKLLASPGASTSNYIHRISAEQLEIQALLAELEGVDKINTGMRNARIKGEDEMDVEMTPEPPVSRIIETKRRVLARRYGPAEGTSAMGTLNMDEAIEIEQRRHAADLERRQRIEEKHRQIHDMRYGDMSKEEREARIFAFMNHKPTDSDMEDDSDEDEDDDDPSSWFEDDQDDGRKGQDIIEPDEEDYYDIIRVDAAKVRYSTFYEPRDDD
ncbi:hypothetical protein ARMSODRAFT_1004030 [Armillaria solidipes]|uniref:Uncharacterized protein n=1 Tax=Armillaria solidipes TaxID=1076256 RepID=A0A2H3BJP1_9AGAR|nr:hypothetical protein ARMSODRAFT_1004030 [Armillaria solidipes]